MEERVLMMSCRIVVGYNAVLCYRVRQKKSSGKGWRWPQDMKKLGRPLTTTMVCFALASVERAPDPGWW